ncbi:flavodoxin family protein [Chloroflexota bacterium]
MKILGLSCSPRKSGNTEILVAEALDGARNEGAEVELFSVSGKDIKPCDGCQSCIETSKCHIKDDMQTIYRELEAADGIIFGTPIYFYGMAAQAKAIMDRTFAIRRPSIKLANKVGGGNCRSWQHWAYGCNQRPVLLYCR